MFPPIEYLQWLRGRPEAALYDLGSSALGEPTPRDAVVPPALDGLDDPPAGVTVHTLLATEYGVEPQQVLVTTGAGHADALAAAVALADAEPAGVARTVDAPDGDAPDGDTTAGDIGDARALVETPCYEPLWRTPAGLGATVERFERSPDGGDGGEPYRLDPERVAGALTPETDLVTVTNRHNPSGRLADRETLAAVADVARDADARLLVDEVYAPYITEPATGDGTAFGGVTAAGVEGAVVTGSLGKFLGVDAGVGWLIADEPFVRAARRVDDHCPSVADPNAALARRALYGADRLAERSRERVRENAGLLRSFVAERDDLAGAVPAGSTVAFLDAAAGDGDAVAAAAWEAGLLVVPGRLFGDPDRFRVSLGSAPEDAAAGLGVLGDVLDRLAR